MFIAPPVLLFPLLLRRPRDLRPVFVVAFALPLMSPVMFIFAAILALSPVLAFVASDVALLLRRLRRRPRPVVPVPVVAAVPVSVVVVSAAAGVAVVAALVLLLLPLRPPPVGENENWCNSPGTELRVRLLPDFFARNDRLVGGGPAGVPGVAGVTFPSCIATPVYPRVVTPDTRPFTGEPPSGVSVNSFPVMVSVAGPVSPPSL
jgi:hypothetical protein